MAFKLFPEGQQRVKEPTISFTAGGVINVNRAADERFFKGYERVLLYYDDERRVVGLKPTNEARLEAETISRTGHRIGFAGKSFCQYFGLKVNRGFRASPIWNEAEGLVEVQWPTDED